MLLEQILAQWWRLLASSEALDLLHLVMRVVSYCHIAMAIKKPSKVGYFIILVLFIVALVAAGVIITNPDMDCIKLEIATFKFGE